MTKTEQLDFEIYVMDLAESCRTKEDYERLAENLHQSVENAIMDICLDNGVEDYDPSY